MSTEELKQQLHQSILDGKKELAAQFTQAGLDAGLDPKELLNEVMIPALDEVGSLFQRGDYFVPDMLVSANAMKAGLAILRPLLEQTGSKPIGTVLFLTVKGDIHDIGKDLVKVMMEGAGLNVVDLGVNVTPQAVTKAIEDYQPEVVGFSAFLTTTMPMFQVNIDAIKAAAQRDRVKIMVGGAPVTEEYARLVGADGYARDASTAARIAIDFIKNPSSSPYLLGGQAVGSRKYSRAAGKKADLFEPKRKLAARTSMKPVERVIAVLRHQEPDRVPHFEWVYDEGVIKKITVGGTLLDLVEQLDVDAIVVSPTYRKEKIGGGLLRDEWGAVRTVGKEDYAMPIDEQAPVQTLEDLAKWQVPDPDAAFRYEPIRNAVKRFGGQRAIILQARDVWSGPRDYIGYMLLLTSLLECPELVQHVVERCVDHYIRVIQRAAEIGANVVFTGDDIADNRGPLFSPKIWESLFIPHYKRLVRAIHETGLYHWKHSDGNMYPFLDSIVEAGSDGIDPIDPLGGMELKVVKAKYGKRVAIKGNVDQTHLLMYGPPEKVVEAVKTCIRDSGENGGYVCSSSNSIHSGVDPELYKVMVGAIHHYGQYPLDPDLLALDSNLPR